MCAGTSTELRRAIQSVVSSSIPERHRPLLRLHLRRSSLELHMCSWCPPKHRCCDLTMSRLQWS